MDSNLMIDPWGFVEANDFQSLNVQIENKIAQGAKTDAAQDEAIGGIEAKNEEQDTAISGIEQKNAEQDATNESQDTEISEMKNEIASLKEATSGSAEVASDVEELKQASSEHEEKIAALTESLSGLSQSAEEEASKLQAEIDRAIEAENDINEKVDAHTSDTTVHVTQDNKDAWNAKLDEEDVKSFFNVVEYDSEAKKIKFLHDDEVKAEIDATDFVKDGMIENVEILEGSLVITFNTDSGKQNINIPIEDIFDAQNYYTKSDIDGLLAQAAQASKANLEGAIGDLKDECDETYAKKSDIPTNISSFTNDSNYATTGQVEAAKSEVSSSVDALSSKVETEYAKKADYMTADEVHAEISAVTAQIPQVPTNVSAFANDASYVDSNTLAVTLDEYAKKDDVDAKIEGLATESFVADKIDEAIATLATKEEIADKVDWTESENGRKHIILKNHDSLLGTSTSGTTYNIAMVSKWDVADFGSAQLHLNLNSSDKATINDTNKIATEEWVGEQGFLKSEDVSGFATNDALTDAVNQLSTKDASQDAIIALKADATAVYTQEDVDALILEKEREIYNLTRIVGDMGGAVTYELPNALGTSFNSAMGNNGTVKLTEDLTSGRFGPGITAKNAVKLNLNGHDLSISGLTISSAFPAIMARGSQQITIGGKGTIDAGEGICIEANGADSVINLTGSTTIYHTNRSSGELVYCYAGTINITNGTFKNDGDDKKFVLNCYDANYRNGSAKIVVTGGKFYDFDPGNNAAEGEGTSFLAEGYESVASTVEEDGVQHTVYTVKKIS